MGRSADDVFRDHLLAVNSGDMQTIVKDYGDHAKMLTAQGPLRDGQASRPSTPRHSHCFRTPRLPSSTQLRERTVCLCGGVRSHLLDALTTASTPLCSRTA